jgi:hypothetical protein
MLHFSSLNGARVLALLLLTVSSALAQTSWAPYFGNAHFGFSTGTLTTGRFPSAAVMADLDGDGDLDAVVAKAGVYSGGAASSGFTVLLNLGAGYYGAPTQYSAGHPSQDVAVGEFTGDTIPDVVVTNTGNYNTGSTVALFPGVGNGTFGTSSTFVVGTGPTGLTAADFNADGRLDLAVANNGGGNGSSVSILYSNGTNGFNTALTVATQAAPYSLVAGRLDSDALPDLVVGHDQQRLSVLRNTGSGFVVDSAYQIQAGNQAGDTGPAVAIADIDQDQDLDVLYSSPRTGDGTGGQIAIRRNTGAGSLGPVQLVTMDAYSSGAGSLKVADLNADGRPDLVASSASGRTGDGYRVMLNLGGGSFGPAQLRPGGQHTVAVAIGDVNQDSYPDVLTVDDYSMELTVHRNSGTGQFPTPTLFTAGIPSLAGTIDVGDIDHDGDLDIVTSSDVRTTIAVPVTVIINNGGGTFAPAVTIAPAGVQAKIRDLNGDGFPDLVFAGGTGSTGYNFYTALYQGLGGSAGFATPRLWTVGACAPEDIDAADMDGDGDLDIVTSSGCSGVVHVSYNQGSATFGQAVAYPAGTSPGALALADFNRDGHPDIAVGAAAGISVLLRDTVTNGFRSPFAFSMASGPFDILATDVNDDGKADLASCNYGSNPGSYSMTLRLGNGDGTFGPVQLLPAAYSPDLANVSGITCGDIDNDFDLDLMVSNNATNDMSIYLNQGNGVFSAALRAGLYYGARSPLFADFNNDGHCEVAALVSLPPGGFQSALVVLQGTNSGFRTGNAATVLGTTAAAQAAALQFGAWPNPFGQATNLTFNLDKPATTSLTVYNLLGQVVARPLHSQRRPAGPQSVSLAKGPLAAGTYLARLEANGATRTIKVVVE